MPGKIGEKRLMALLEQGTDLYTLPVQQQVQAFITMARVMSQPPAGTPRRVPRHRRHTCNAVCRTGRRCRAKVVWDKDEDRPKNTKCRIHGGLSRGPTTPEGRRRIGESNQCRARERRQAQAQAAALAQVQAQAVARAAALEA